MPPSKPSYHDANNSREYGEQDVVDGHKRLGVLAITEDLTVHPRGRRCETNPAEEGQVDEKQYEHLVVSQADTGGEPRAVMVHFQDTALACRAVVSAVRLPGLALVTEPDVARRSLDGEGCILHTSSFLCGQVTVAIVEVQGRARISEDGGCVAPIKHKVEEDTEGRRELA